LPAYPTFCGQDFLDIQDRVSYTLHRKKKVLINDALRRFADWQKEREAEKMA
jgi:hypothetical protein